MTIINTPDWVKNAVFYQIFPDRFGRSSEPHPGLWRSNCLEAWDAQPTYEGYKGGDLWAVIDKLDYLQDLGINALYFNPIFQSAANHRYHPHDFYQVDPMLGGNIAFEALLEAAHQREIKVILDGVFNHAGRGFFFFSDILENGGNSAWLDWFKVEDWPLAAYDGSKPANYISWVGNRALPQFNHDNPQVREYIMQVGEYWLHKGIDGWRLDVPNEVKSAGFWSEFRDRVKAINPEAYIVGEIWSDASPWLDGKQFDGVMNYRFAEPTIAFTAGDRFIPEYIQYHYEPYPALNAQQYGDRIQELLGLYPWEIQLTQFNLLNSHDTSRVLTSTGGDKDSVHLATCLLLTFPGAPCIYYGDEIGLPGGKDPDCRRGFPEKADWDLDTLKYHQQLIALHHQYPALRTGKYQILYAEAAVYVFARVLDAEVVMVAINVETSETTVNFALPDLPNQPEKPVYGGGSIAHQVNNGENSVELRLPPRNACIFA
ncbi:glycosidase [Xenococcus sp. PCC 7305]|uniref:glycoside hydrolase family 13 protein n=1 Tax=Xenococcus sp. PCC 7305 TaxID=102125 RepID=UPI0002ACF5CB|nr:glycoside hydrolase family 13 protein [Xenococcus sp. PCC 7305]ELS05107.1 glycosidase [Xenococcus sp. PCC 7305]